MRRNEIPRIMREAIVSLSEDEMEAIGVGEMISVFEDAGMVDLEEEECRANGGLMRAEVETRIDAERLSSLEPIEDWELVAEKEDTFLYLVDFTAPGLPDMSEQADELVGTCDPTVNELEDETTVSLVGEQEAIREVLREYEDAGMSPELRSLGEYEGDEDPLDSLTDRQRETVEMAYEMGFYDVPRDASAEEVASELGVDASTVAEHLQRAEKNLLGQHFSV